ncbi:hypothetical protein GQX74_003451 [Glossina fuscipes]|nr:hypothetical protein GQX74_003451 [Glossina fuscipes]
MMRKLSGRDANGWGYVVDGGCGGGGGDGGGGGGGGGCGGSRTGKCFIRFRFCCHFLCVFSLMSWLIYESIKKLQLAFYTVKLRILSFLSLEESFMFCIYLLSDDDNDDVADDVAAAAPTATEEAEVDWKADEDDDAAAEAEDDEGNDELTVVTKVVVCPVFERGAETNQVA